uniref:CUB domain-containing protein n=1 Tax=Poecilia mexicana TaxID=48701 RepID=A0A3B3XUI0_9TELE
MNQSRVNSAGCVPAGQEGSPVPRLLVENLINYTGEIFLKSFCFNCSGCGGDLVMQSGAFNSPNYPDAYPPNMECVWTLRSSPGNRMQISFIMFHLQGDSDCQNDYLEIREGSSAGSLVGRFCGASLPSNYTSVTGSTVTLHFKSDSAVGGRGFLVDWTAVKDSGPPPTITPGKTKR